MRKLNLIVIFNKNLDKVLFCIRAKEPYKGLYNFVGGKLEENESNDEAAYRELFEETGISYNDIELEHFMDLNYFKYENNLQVYYGILQHEVNLVEEKNKLEWICINEELLNVEKFAAYLEGNLPENEMQQISTLIENDDALKSILDVSEQVDASLEDYASCGLQIPEELLTLDFELPNTNDTFVPLDTAPTDGILMSDIAAYTDEPLFTEDNSNNHLYTENSDINNQDYSNKDNSDDFLDLNNAQISLDE